MLNTKPGKEKEYSDWFDKNTDSYSRRCFTFAEGWAEKMENEISKMPPMPLQLTSLLNVQTEQPEKKILTVLQALCMVVLVAY